MYKALPEELHMTADAVIKFFNTNYGLLEYKIEQSLNEDIQYRPTIIFFTRDYYYYCIDVSNNIINPTRLLFINECEKRSLPVKFFITLPTIDYPDFSRELKKAQEYGLGIIDSNPNCKIITNPIPLSLTNIRYYEPYMFSKKYRITLMDAIREYKNGNPSGACSIIYNELEALCRKIAIHANKNGKLENLTTTRNLHKESWSILMTRFEYFIKNNPYNKITPDLVFRIRGLTGYRNQTNHKPNSLKKLIERDRALRTRMENCLDIFIELQNSSKFLR